MPKNDWTIIPVVLISFMEAQVGRGREPRLLTVPHQPLVKGPERIPSPELHLRFAADPPMGRDQVITGKVTLTNAGQRPDPESGSSASLRGSPKVKGKAWEGFRRQASDLRPQNSEGHRPRRGLRVPHRGLSLQSEA